MFCIIGLAAVFESIFSQKSPFPIWCVHSCPQAHSLLSTVIVLVQNGLEWLDRGDVCACLQKVYYDKCQRARCTVCHCSSPAARNAAHIF